MHGVVPIQDALKMAKERELDLLEVGAGEIPICKLIDYGKFKYQKKKKDQEAKKKQTVISVKEVQVSPKIEKHDLEFKTKHIERFLKDGDKAKIVLIFKGREIVYVDQGRVLLDRIIDSVKDVGQIEQPPKLEGKRLSAILCPSKHQKPKKEKIVLVGAPKVAPVSAPSQEEVKTESATEATANTNSSN